MDNSDDSIKEMKLFSNQTRRDLLKIIGESGGLSFTAIKEELNLTDGRLYFHLKKLGEYIEKDPQNNYKLTLEGKKIYDTLFFQQKPNLEFEVDNSSYLLNRFIPESIIYFFISTKTRSLIELNVLLLTLSWFFGVTNSYFSSVETLVLGGAIINFIINIIHWYIYAFLIYIILKIEKKKISLTDIIITTIIGIGPYIIYLLPKGILILLSIEISGWINIILLVTFIVCKIWSTLIIAQGITIVGRIHSSQALLIAIILVLIDYIYLFVTLAL